MLEWTVDDSADVVFRTSSAVMSVNTHVPPILVLFSKTVGWIFGFSAKYLAEQSPAGPAPIIATRAILDVELQKCSVQESRLCKMRWIACGLYKLKEKYLTTTSSNDLCSLKTIIMINKLYLLLTGRLMSVTGKGEGVWSLKQCNMNCG